VTLRVLSKFGHHTRARSVDNQPVDREASPHAGRRPSPGGFHGREDNPTSIGADVRWQLQDGLDTLELRLWSEGDGVLGPRELDDRASLTRLLRRVALEPGTWTQLRALAAALDWQLGGPLDDDALLTRLADQIAAGSVALVARPCEPLPTEPVEHPLTLEPDERSLGRIEASIRLDLFGRIVMLEGELDVALELPAIEHELEPELIVPALEHELEPELIVPALEHELDASAHGETDELDLDAELIMSDG
jgi:hypothetical protein